MKSPYWKEANGGYNYGSLTWIHGGLNIMFMQHLQSMLNSLAHTDTNFYCRKQQNNCFYRRHTHFILVGQLQSKRKSLFPCNLKTTQNMSYLQSKLCKNDNFTVLWFSIIPQYRIMTLFNDLVQNRLQLKYMLYYLLSYFSGT